MSEIGIPEAALEYWFACGCGSASCHRSGFSKEALPIIMAENLRWLMVTLECRNDIETVRRLADELDPEGVTR